MNALTFSRVSINYGGSTVVRDVSFDIRRGSWFCLIGPNGAGKTSLLRAAIGLAPHTGEIRITTPDKRQALVQSLTVRERAHVFSYVPQRPSLSEGKTVMSYLAQGRWAGNETLDVAEELLHACRLSRLRDRLVSQLSVGERQKLVLARALMQCTNVLVLDEPTSSLDLGLQREILGVIDSLRKDRGITILSTMQNLTLASRYSEKCALLSNGELVAIGQTRDVLTRELISEHYGIPVQIDDRGENLLVLPSEK